VAGEAAVSGRATTLRPDATCNLPSFRQHNRPPGGRTWEGTARTVSSTPGERIELALVTKEIRGRVSIDLTPDADHSLVSVRVEVEPAGMMATLFWGVVREAITSSFNHQVDEFAAGF